MTVIPVEVFLAEEASPAALEADAAAVIRDLSSRVTSPEYVRTPQFARRGRARGGRGPTAASEMAKAPPMCAASSPACKPIHS